jgi:hypothetical protein
MSIHSIIGGNGTIGGAHRSAAPQTDRGAGRDREC